MRFTLAAGCLAVLWAAGPAAAQRPAAHAAGATCNDKNCGVCGLRQHPMLEKRYIRQFCGPTIAPGSCFGHFQTQWTPWGAACPNWCGGNVEYTGLGWGPPPHPSYVGPGATAPPAPPATLPPAGAPMPPPDKKPAEPGKLAPAPQAKVSTPLPAIPEVPINVRIPASDPPARVPTKY